MARKTSSSAAPDLLSAPPERKSQPEPSVEHFRIVGLHAENIKRIVAIDIKPGDGVVQITGGNAQGKSSVLDAILFAMGGKKAIQARPVRRGEEEGEITLDLGALKIRRTFRVEEDQEITTTLHVLRSDGAKYTNPQSVMASLYGALTFDPIAFARLAPVEQFSMLRQFVPEVDFDGIEKANSEAREERKAINRELKTLRLTLDAMQEPTGELEQPEDVEALTKQLAEASEHNVSIERKRQNRQSAVETIGRRRAEADQAEAAVPDQIATIETACQTVVARAESQIAELQQQIVKARAQADTSIAQAKSEAAEVAKIAREEADQLQSRLDAAGPLPTPVDPADISTRLARARDLVAEAQRRRTRELAASELQAKEVAAEALTADITERLVQMRDAVAQASMPIEGLAFGGLESGEPHVTFNDIPLEQISTAEQIQISMAIAMAANPRLRVALIREGSLLDSAALAAITEMAARNDFQVWVESVNETGEVGFVIEEGRVVSTPDSRAQQNKEAAE